VDIEVAGVQDIRELMIYQAPEQPNRQNIVASVRTQHSLQNMTRQRDEKPAHGRARANSRIINGAIKASSKRESGKLQHEEGYLIKELQQRLRTQIEARIRAKGLWLSFPHSVVLMTLQAEPGLSGAQLARRNSVTAQTMNGLLVPLETKGLIERRADPENARTLQCFLKPKGTEILEQGMHEARAVFGQMLGKLSERERDEFKRILQRCISALQTSTGVADDDALRPRKSAARKSRAA
jgi:DNA-binding MarR family transcriptional regulator